jgi:hypothetical protein
MGLPGVHAGGEGVQAADAVRKALFFTGIPARDRRRGLVAEAFGREAFKHVIGAKRAGFPAESPACGGAPASGARRSPASSLGPRQHIARAMGVVMMRKGARIGGIGHQKPLDVL